METVVVVSGVKIDVGAAFVNYNVLKASKMF